MKSILRCSIILLAVLQNLPAVAQNKEAELLAFEKSIDKAVVDADMEFLKKAYADDFRFKHSTGLIDTKESWLAGVEKNKGKFVSRELDSVEVEIHDDVAITQGRLIVKRVGSSYGVKYVRVYKFRNKRWQLIMHRSTADIKL